MQWLRARLNFHPFWLALLAPLLMGVTLHWSMKKLIATTRHVTHIHQVLAELDDIPLQLGRAHTAHSDYVLTGNEQYLTAYQTAVHETQKEIEEVRQLIPEDKGQQKRLLEVENIAHEQFTQLQRAIELRKTEGFDAALQALMEENTADTTDRLDAFLQGMKHEAWRLLAARSAAANTSAHQLDVLIIGDSLMALLLLIVANFIIARRPSERAWVETAWQASTEQNPSLSQPARGGAELTTSDETVAHFHS